MKKVCIIITFLTQALVSVGQEYTTVNIDSEVTDVQPMTGMVFWPGNSKIDTDAISLEYSYMDFSQIMTGKSSYDWTVVDDLLDEMASRNHQAVLRFRYSYPGKTTTVPQYIKDLSDYVEVQGLSEGRDTWFPDWTHPELKRFTLEFYEKYAERYDKDPRLGFVQVGFGLWAEYHIYDGPFEMGVTFPDRDFQKEFFNKLDEVFEDTYWSISIDAADGTYGPFSVEPDLKDITFGLFDDSFMHSTHSGYNTSNWNFFDRERYLVSPAGGEFSYYSDYDQKNVLNPDIGPYGTPYEIFAQNFHITYINANDQSSYQTIERVKEASMNSGYKFKLVSVKTKTGSTVVELVNLGVAPIYIDAYIAINGVRSAESLKLLAPDQPKEFTIDAGGDNINLSIESDDILSTETIQYFGTENEYERYVQPEPEEPENPVLAIDDENLPLGSFTIYPTVSDSGIININYNGNKTYELSLIDVNGKKYIETTSNTHYFLNTAKIPSGIYLLVLNIPAEGTYEQKIIIK